MGYQNFWQKFEGKRAPGRGLKTGLINQKPVITVPSVNQSCQRFKSLFKCNKSSFLKLEQAGKWDSDKKSSLQLDLKFQSRGRTFFPPFQRETFSI